MDLAVKDPGVDVVRRVQLAFSDIGQSDLEFFQFVDPRANCRSREVFELRIIFMETGCRRSGGIPFKQRPEVIIGE
jgi:hypothetical protein